MDLMSLVAKLSLDTSDYDKGIDKAKGSAQSLSAGAVAVGNLISSGFQAAGNVITNFAGNIIDTGKSFDSSMSQVMATMGLSGDEADKAYDIMKAAAQQAGESTAYSAKQSADALNYLALAGYDAEKAADVLPSVLSLAAAGGMDLAYASDLATDAMSALGIEATKGNLDKFGDEMARTASRSNTSVAQLGEAILTVGGNAKQLAGGTNELNTALGVLANRGIKGAEGGTHLRNIILSLTAPTDTAKKAIKDLGLQVTDTHGNLKPLDQIMSDFNKKTDKMSATAKMDLMNTIFNKTDLAAVQALLSGVGEEWDNLSDEIDSAAGAMSQMEKEQLDNLSGDLTIMQSAVEGLSIAFYNGIEGTARNAVQGLTEAIGKITEKVKTWMASDEVQAKLTKIAEAITKIVNKIVNNLDPILNVMIGIFDKVVSAIGFVIDHFDELSTVVGVVVAAFTAFKAASAAMNFAKLLTSPMGLVIAAITGIVFALKSAGVTMDDVKNAFKKGVDKIKSVWSKIEPFSKDTVKKIKTVFAPLTDFISSVFGDGTEKVKFRFVDLQAALSNTWANIKTAVGNAAYAIKDAFMDIDTAQIAESVTGWVSLAIEKISEFGNNIKDFLSEAFGKIDWAGIMNTFSNFIGKTWEIVESIWSGISSAFVSWFNSVDWKAIIALATGWASDAWAFITDIFSSVKDKFLEWFNAVDWNAIADLVGGWAENAWEFIKGIFAGAAQKIADWYTNTDWEAVKAKITSWVSGAWETIKDKFFETATNLKTWFTNINWDQVKSQVTSWVSGAWQTIKNKFSSTASSLKTWFTNINWDQVKTKVTSWISGAWKLIENKFSSTASKLKDWFTNINWDEVKQKVTSWVGNAWEAVKKTFDGAAQKIADWYTKTDWNDVSTKVSEWTQQALTNIGNALKDAAEFIKGLFTGKNKGGSFWTNVAETITPWAKGALTIIDSTLGGVADGLIKYFTNGSESWDSVKKKVTSWVSGAWETIRDAFINFPSSFVSWITSFKISDITSAFAGLADEIWSSFKQGLSKYNPVSYISNWFKGSGEEAASAGSEVGAQLTNGVVAGTKVSGAGTKIGTNVNNQINTGKKDIVKKNRIASPSKVFADEIGKWIPLGVAEGIEKNSSAISDAMNNMVDVKDYKGDYAFANGFSADKSSASNPFGGNGSGDGVVINLTVNGARYQSEQSLAEAISYELQNLMTRRRAVFA